MDMAGVLLVLIMTVGNINKRRFKMSIIWDPKMLTVAQWCKEKGINVKVYGNLEEPDKFYNEEDFRKVKPVKVKQVEEVVDEVIKDEKEVEDKCEEVVVKKRRGRPKRVQ